MSVAESVVEKLQSLTPEQQREVVELVDALAKTNATKTNATKSPRRSLMGLFSDLNVHITEEDIEEARREMWGNFPREDI
ncbi:MAG TPA: hypothetical protein VHE60_04220 [Pyrinomonadaceae bacterium]|nr:hypothetical protein [Pyrinomonadaceae bacterium]